VETLDYTTADSLREKYRSLDIDIQRIEEVDYVSDGGSLCSAAPRRGEYDFVFSSHVLEHAVDIVDYLKSCECSIKEDGVVVLALPDKRFTFDVLRPPSTAGQVLEAHGISATRHSAAAVYDFQSSFAKLDGRESRSNRDKGELKMLHDLSYASACLMMLWVPTGHITIFTDGYLLQSVSS